MAPAVLRFMAHDLRRVWLAQPDTEDQIVWLPAKRGLDVSREPRQSNGAIPPLMGFESEVLQLNSLSSTRATGDSRRKRSCLRDLFISEPKANRPRLSEVVIGNHATRHSHFLRGAPGVRWFIACERTSVRCSH
jgi:hypothetical protein